MRRRKLVKKIIFLICFILVGCDEFTEVEAPFVVYNLGDHPGTFIVNGQEVGAMMAPNASASLKVKVEIPRDDDLSGIDEDETSVTVSFRDAWTGKLAEPVACYAGSKMVTTVTYRIWDPDDPVGNIECRESR